MQVGNVKMEQDAELGGEVSSEYPTGFANAFLTFLDSYSGQVLDSITLIKSYEKWAEELGEPILSDRGLYFDALHLIEFAGDVEFDRELDTVYLVPNR